MDPRRSTLPGYAELHCRSNFSFLTGASHPEELVARAARGLQALGLARGERVAIMGDACEEWILCDLGAQAAGAISYGIYPTASAAEVEWSRKVIDAFGHQENEKKGVIVVEGRMVERLHFSMAQRTVAIAEQIREMEAACG